MVRQPRVAGGKEGELGRNETKGLANRQYGRLFLSFLRMCLFFFFSLRRANTFASTTSHRAERNLPRCNNPQLRPSGARGQGQGPWFY